MTRRGHRRYSEAEMAAILERAAALQGGSALVPVHGGRTLDEIKAIAGEAGLSAAAIDAAARSVHEENVPQIPGLGRSPRMELTTTIAGELDDEDRRQLLGVLRRSLDARGRTSESGKTLEWRRMGVLGREMVVISAHRGKTRLEVRGRYRRGWLASYLGGGLAGGIASAGLLDLAGLTDLLDAGVVPFVLGAAFMAGRGVWSWFSGMKERNLRRVADRLGELAEESVAEAEPGPAPVRALPDKSD